jgi:transposase
MTKAAIQLGDDRVALTRWAASKTLPARVVLRSRIVIARAEGHSARSVASIVGVNRHTVDLWCQRFLEGGCEALQRDRPGRGRKRKAVA